MNKFFSWRAATAIACLCLLQACSSGSGSNDSGPPPPVADTSSPVVTITSPTDGASVTSPAIIVEGTAVDPSGVASISVNGVEASSDNAFANWSVELTLDLGSNNLVVSARDSLGNSSADALSFAVTYVDGTAPAVNISQPTDGDVFANRLVEVYGTATDDINLASVTVNGVAAATTDGFANWSVESLSIVYGSNVIEVVATDSAGNQTSETVTVGGLDVTAPTVEIVDPQDMTQTQVSVLVVTGLAGDTESGIARVIVNGIDAITSDGFANWTAQIPLPSFTTSGVSATAIDVDGNQSNATIQVINGDYVAPAVGVIVPSQTPAATAGTRVFIQGVAYDSGIGVAAVRVNGNLVETSDDFSTWSLLQVITDGANSFNIQAEDGAGNFSPVTIIQVNRDDSVDNDGPTTEIYFPPAGSKVMSETITVRGVAMDSDGVAYIAVNGVPASSDDGFETWQVVIPMSHNPDFAISVAAQDFAGSYADSAVSISVDSAQGTDFRGITAIATNPITELPVVIDNRKRIVAINADGSGTVVRQTGFGSLSAPLSLIEADTMRNLLLVTGGPGNSSILYTVDPENGDFTAFSLGVVPERMFYNAADGALYIQVDDSLYVYDTFAESITLLIATLPGDLHGFVPDSSKLFGFSGSSITMLSEYSFFAIDLQTLETETLPLVVSPEVDRDYYSISVDIAAGDNAAYLRVLDFPPYSVPYFDNQLLRYDFDTGAVISVLDEPELTEDAFPYHRKLSTTDQSGRIYLTDKYSVNAFEIDSGDVIDIAGRYKGQGVRTNYNGLAWSAVDSAWIVGGNTDLMTIDPVTGDRDIRFESFFGLSALGADIASFDEGQSLLISSDDTANLPLDTKMHTLDLVSDQRQIVPLPPGTDEDLNQVSAVAYDNNRQRGVYGSFSSSSGGSNRVASVYLSSGVRVPVSGPLLNSIPAIVVDPINDLYIANAYNLLYAVNPVSGESDYVRTAARPGQFFSGGGPTLFFGLAHSDGTNDVFTCSEVSYSDLDYPDSSKSAVVRVNMTHDPIPSDNGIYHVSGDLLDSNGSSNLFFGNGPELDFRSWKCGLQYNDKTGALMVLVDGYLFGVDTITGDRVIISH